MADDDETQSPEEMAVHYAGPVAAALQWLACIGEGDFAGAWLLMDDDLRLARAQAWLWNNRTHPAIAGRPLDEWASELAAVPPSCSLWEAFAKTDGATYWKAFSRFDPVTWGAASRPRPVGLDYEVALFIETGGEVVTFEDGPHLVDDAIVLLMHYEDGRWRVAHAGSDQPVVLGWPPQFPSAPTPTD